MSFNVSQYVKAAEQAARGQSSGYAQPAAYQSEVGINLSAMERARQSAATEAARRLEQENSTRVTAPKKSSALQKAWDALGKPFDALWKDNTIRTNDERDQLMAELKRIQNANSMPMVKRRNEIRARLKELDEELGNGEMSYGIDRLADTVTGGVKGWAGDQATFFGKGAELLSRIGEKLGSNTSDYAGWATDEMSAAQIGNENDATKRLQELAEAKAMQDTGRRWSETGASEIERAKNGLGQLGRLGVDLGANAVQMGLDAGTAALTGGSGALVPLFTRASGGGMREAEAAGADLKHQLLYGSTVGAVEAATEMLTGGLAKFYGAGSADELVERAVRKMTTSEVGRRALLTLSDMAGEGVEEIISDIVNPYAKALYDGGEALKKKFGSVEGFKEAASEELYDGLVGALMGGFGSVTKTVSGDTARTVQRMGYADQAEGSLRSQWGTDMAGRRASSEYAQLIARQMMGEDLNQADQAKFNARPTAVGVLEGMQNQQYEDFRQTEEGRSYEQKAVKSWIDDAFSDENLSEDQKNILAEGVGTGTASMEEYAAGVHNAYNLGKTKVTLEQARQAANENGQKLNDVQFQHAYQMGYSAAAETADTTTEEGRTTVVSNLRALGSRAERAAETYQAGQDVGSYSNAMINAVEYAATGADLKAITQTARRGGSLSWTGHLTEAQVQRAEELGRELQEERKQNTKKRVAQLAGIQEEAARIRKEQNPDAVTIGTKIRDIQNFIAETQEEVSGIMQGLKIARQAQPGIVDTAEYKERMAQADEMRVQIREAKKTKNELRAKRQAARKGQGRQKGRAIYESKAGEAGGLRYKAVNRAGLSGTQKAAARVAEAIAEATGLEIHIVDFGKGFGGEYFPGTGGKLYLNINAAFDGKNFSIMSLSHELTHWLQEYAPEQYAELKQVVLAEMQRNPERYESIFQERKGRQADLTSEQITDEMVANACQTVLLDTDAIQRIVNEHRTLAERILDFILQLVDDIREAFGEVDLSTDRSIFREMHAVEDAVDQVRDLWLDAFETATENLQAQKTVFEDEKSAVSRGTGLQSQVGQPSYGESTPENSLPNPEPDVKGEQLQAWDEGTVYNNRALVSEDTLEQWLKDYAASNPNYAQAYIAYMSPGQFLGMTTSGIASRMAIEDQAEGLSVGHTVKYSKRQPIQLHINTETGKVEGHEGRHRMVALRKAGVYDVPVLLFDSSNKYGKQAMESLDLIGQDFRGRENTAATTIHDVQPLSRGNADVVREKFGRKSIIERMQEQYNGRQTVQFQAVGSEDSGTLSIKEQIRAHETDLNTKEPVANVQVTDMPKGVQKQRQWAVNRLKNTGYAVDVKKLGRVEFTPSQINTGINYLDEPGEIAAFAALPQVLKRGDIINRHQNHKSEKRAGRTRGSVTIAAPVVINGVRGNMAVALTETTKLHYHTHRIVMPDGKTFVFDEKNDAAPKPVGELPAKQDLIAEPISSTSANSIADAEETVNTEAEQAQAKRVQYSVFEEDPETLAWLGKQEEDGDVVHTYKSFLEIDGKLYPPMASMKKGPDGKWKMTKAMEVGRWEKSVGDPSKIEVDPKNGRGYFTLKKDDGSTVKAAYNPYQHSSNLMINDQFTGAYSRPGLVTYECIIPKSELTSGYRAEYAKDAVGVHSWKAGPVAGKLIKAKGTERQVYLSRWLKPIRKVPDAEVAQHYKELLDGTDIAVPSNVVPPSLLHALEDAGVKIEYDPRAPKTQLQRIDRTGAELTEDQEKFFADSKIRDDQGRLKVMYRGGNGDFTVFDRNKSSYSNLYGRGFYFTDSKSHAEQYGKARAFYLNIQNPVREGTHDITRAQLRKFLQEVGENEDYGLENYGYGATVDSVMRGLRGKDDFGILQDINATAIGDFVAAVELFNEVNGTSFDGIIAPTETVAFRAEQIKNTDNKAPTSDPDVRFQMISEVEESGKLIAVHNKTMSGLRRMIERGGVPFPSIAIKKAGSGHNHYGPVSIVFGRSRIDPEVNRANRIYGGDAWTPTEPRTEYEADSKKAYKVREQISKAVGSQMFEALRMGGSLDSDEIERKLGDNEGNIFEAMKGTAVLKYAYLKSIGKEPEIPTREKSLDGFGRYTNEQLLNLFKTIGAERIHRADYSDQEFRQKAADILNEEFIKDFRKRKAARGASKEAIDAVVKSYKEKPVYVAGDISVNAIKDALRTFENDGRKLQKEPDSSSFTSAMRDNKEIEEDPGYRRWIEDLYSGIIKDSGIRNDKDPFTPSGSRRSFKQLHVPATLDNIAKIMGKQNEKGVTSFAGSNLMGTGTKTYRTVEEARADRGRLYDGDYIDEEEFEGPKKVLNDRLQELVEAAAKITSRDYAWEQRDSAREILLEAVRDSKTKAAMDRKLRSEAQWINYDPTLTDELWQLAEDTRNMKVPYFEAKLRRVVYPEEALAYIVEDTAEETDADLLKKMRDQGLNVLTYKAGDKEDRLRVLNSVEGAQFQRYDEQIQGQMMFDEVENSNMHPRMRERLTEAEQLTEDVKAYFGSIPGSPLSAEDIENMMDFDVFNQDAIGGDMLDPAAIVDELLATAETGGEYRRRQAYRLAERLLGHMPALARQNYVGDGNTDRVQDRAFADWYNARHPSLYYPGYQPGDLFEHKYNKGGKADEIQKEKDYLHGLLESGNLMEPELSEARELLDRLNNPQPKEVFYQQYDDTYEDTEAESNERALAYTRLQNENAMLIDIIDKMSAVVKGKDKTIEKILKKLARSRRSDAEKLAKQLVKEYSSKADIGEVAAAIKEVGDYFVQTPTESLNPEQAKELARKAAGLIAANAEDVLEETRDEVYGQIRDSIKGRKLSIRPEYAGELDQYGGYNAFKKANAGNFTLTRADRVKNADEFVSVDQFYQDLNRTFGDAYFPEAGSDNGPVNEGEMVKIIADAFEAGEPITVNPFEAYMGEATEMIANTIAFRVLNDNVLKPLLPAEAEKAFDQLKAANGENAELRKELDRATTRGEVMKEELERLQKEGRLSKKELVELRDEVYELTNALKKADQEYSALQEQAEQRLQQVKEEGRARVTEVKARERERAAKQIDELKKHYQELQKKAKERREESAGTKKYREQVKKKAATLYEMLARNDDKHHVPEVLKRPVAEFLESLDFTSKRALRGGDETKADLKFGERLRELERMLSGQQSYIDGSSNVQADLGGYVDISEENMDYLRTCIEMVDQALKMGREFTINSMNAQQLKQLSNFLSNLNTAIRNLNNFMANARFESIREAAGQDIEQMKKMGDVSERETGKASGFLMWENGTPYYVFKRFGKGGQSIFDGFARGWEKMAFRAQEIMKFTENLYTDKEVRDWKTKVNEFTLSDGSKMKITTAQIMELSMLLNREQALKHIEAGGIQIGDIQTKKGTKISTAQYHLTMEDILQITGTLDARQRKVAKALQGYMARKGAEWGNEISMRRFGYNFYTEGENYYPIKTVPTDRPMSDQDLPQNASMFRLLNLSSSKSLNPHANNALVVGNIFDTFADHMSDMAKLNGMGLPILDAIKYFNYKEKIPGDGKTFTTETMQATIKQAYGPKALSYFRKLMQDINGTTESGDRGDPGFGKLLSNYKIAAVGANLRVALLQPTSYVRATAVLKPQYMVGIVPSRAAYQEAIKYSGTAVWKSLGYYDTDIARGMRGQIQHDDTWKDKVAEASMKAAELGDQLTWSMLWTACKRQAKGENSNLRGQALMDRTADLFRETVYASQVMDSTLTRSEIMRGKTHFTKAASAFMAEPTLSYNILLDAYSQFRTDERKAGRGAAWQKNGGKIGKAFAVYVSSAAFAAIVESIVDALRDDDDDEAVDKFLQAFLGEDALSSEAGMLQRLKSVWLNGNLGQDLTIIGKLPFVKDIMSILQGYGASNMATDGIESVMKAIDILKGNGSKRLTPWGKIYKYLQPISQLSGLAISNLSRDAVAIWNATAGMINPEMKLRKYDAIAFTDELQAGYDEYVKPTGISKAQFQRILSAANTDGNTSVKQDEMGEYLVDALAANEITEEQAQALWKSQWNKESSKTFDKWRGKEEPKSTTSAPTKTTSTVGSTAKKSSQPSGQIEGWDDFKTVAPIYGGPKREATYNAKPSNMSLTEYTKMLQAADADGNKSLKQDELGFALKAAVQGGQMSWEAAMSVWAAQGWSHDLSWWAAKHP